MLYCVNSDIFSIKIGRNVNFLHLQTFIRKVFFIQCTLLAADLRRAISKYIEGIPRTLYKFVRKVVNINNNHVHIGDQGLNRLI